MKTFPQFISEATAASVQAKRLGLVGDGHGGWYNRATGEFEAKTFGGQLKFYNKRQVIGSKDPKQSEFEKNISMCYMADPVTAQSKLMQLDLLLSILELPKTDLSKLLTDIVYVAKKEGRAFGPFGKVY